jgi:hypothetical protein
VEACGPYPASVRYALDARSFILSASCLRCGAKTVARAAKNSGADIFASSVLPDDRAAFTGTG